jgi:hypothetical protein
MTLMITRKNKGIIRMKRINQKIVKKIKAKMLKKRKKRRRKRKLISKIKIIPKTSSRRHSNSLAWNHLNLRSNKSRSNRKDLFGKVFLRSTKINSTIKKSWEGTSKAGNRKNRKETQNLEESNKKCKNTSEKWWKNQPYLQVSRSIFQYDKSFR